MDYVDKRRLFSGAVDKSVGRNSLSMDLSVAIRKIQNILQRLYNVKIFAYNKVGGEINE